MKIVEINYQEITNLEAIGFVKEMDICYWSTWLKSKYINRNISFSIIQTPIELPKYKSYSPGNRHFMSISRNILMIHMTNCPQSLSRPIYSPFIERNHDSKLSLKANSTEECRLFLQVLLRNLLWITHDFFQSPLILYLYFCQMFIPILFLAKYKTL